MHELDQLYVSMTQGEQGIGRSPNSKDGYVQVGSAEVSCMYKVCAKAPGQNTQDQAPGRRKEDERRYATGRERYTGYERCEGPSLANLFMPGAFHRGYQQRQ
jgi:hypothetical protein